MSGYKVELQATKSQPYHLEGDKIQKMRLKIWKPEQARKHNNINIEFTKALDYGVWAAVVYIFKKYEERSKRLTILQNP